MHNVVLVNRSKTSKNTNRRDKRLPLIRPIISSQTILDRAAGNVLADQIREGLPLVDEFSRLGELHHMRAANRLHCSNLTSDASRSCTYDDLEHLVVATATTESPGIALASPIDELEFIDAFHGRTDCFFGDSRSGHDRKHAGIRCDMPLDPYRTTTILGLTTRVRARWNAASTISPMLARRIVGIALGGGDVAVTHPLLEGAQRDAGGGHAGAEGVAQVVEAVLFDAGGFERGGEGGG